MAKAPLLILGMIAPELCRSNQREDEEGYALCESHGANHFSCLCAVVANSTSPELQYFLRADIAHSKFTGLAAFLQRPIGKF
jgi:hypothetical protein